MAAVKAVAALTTLLKPGPRSSGWQGGRSAEGGGLVLSATEGPAGGGGGRVLLPVPQDFCGHEEEALLAGGTVVQLVQCGGGGLTCRNTFRKVWGRGKQD